jgi:hypothetical protein
VRPFCSPDCHLHPFRSYNRYIAYGRIKPVRHGEYALFAAAAAGIVYSYQKRGDAMRGSVRSLLGWLWGHC